MALLQAIRRVIPASVTSDGSAPTAVDSNRDGELYRGPDSIQRAIMRGLGGRATVGAFSTGITGGGAGTILDQDQPEISISVASGYVMQIVDLRVQCQVPLLATDADEAEILVALDRAAAQDGTGTATAETVYNMRSDLGTSGPAGLTIRSAYTADATNPTLAVELARKVITGDVQGTAATALWTPLDLVYAPEHPDYIVGPACVYVYWGGTVATPGFAQVAVVVRPTGFFG